MQSSSGSTSTTTHTRHVPVLLQEVLEVLNIQENDVVVDATFGGGGHSNAFAAQLGTDGHLVAFDTDASALARAENQFTDTAAQVTLINANFRSLATELEARGITQVDKVFFDLGWSSDQLESSGRGFSFDREEPLLMTLSDTVTEETLTAHEIVNEWAEENIADVLFGWGGERFSRRIARAIVVAREEKPIATTAELATLVKAAVPTAYRHGKRHPATKTFQALRIAVNDELGALREALAALPQLVCTDGIVAALSFHSQCVLHSV